MTAPQRARRPRRARACALLVLAVLAGLVAMHGLGPDPVPAGHAHTDRAASPASTPGAHGAKLPAGYGQPAADEAGAACHHAPDGHDQGHLHHADPTCAASGISGGPAMPALAPAGTAGDDAPAPLPGAEPATAAERAPPSLAQLQLMRI